MPAPKDPIRYKKRKAMIWEANRWRKHTDEAKKKISIAWKRKMPDEQKQKISKARKWMKFTQEHKDNMSRVRKWKPSWHKWRKRGIETKEKLRQSRLWKKASDYTKKKMSKTRKWHLTSEETKRKIGEAQRWEKNHQRRWWLSYQWYTTDWTKTLRRAIRERDKYICQVCWELQSDRARAVHHIDYNKNNCDPDNLVTLCHSCHTKTNTNREYRVSFFKNWTTDPLLSNPLLC